MYSTRYEYKACKTVHEILMKKTMELLKFAGKVLVSVILVVFGIKRYLLLLFALGEVYFILIV